MLNPQMGECQEEAPDTWCAASLDHTYADLTSPPLTITRTSAWSVLPLWETKQRGISDHTPVAISITSNLTARRPSQSTHNRYGL